MGHKILTILILSVLSVCQGKTLTASIGGKCAKIKDGYTKCHTITVKYNLEKGRISTDGYYDDDQVRFMVRLWDADSMRIDFVAHDLYVNAHFAGDEYIVPKELAAETKYLDIAIYDEDFSPYAEEHGCYNDANVVWNFPKSDGSGSNEYRCLPADTILSVCKSIIRNDAEETTISCYKDSKPHTSKSYNRQAILPKRAWIRWIGDTYEFDDVVCPAGYNQVNDVSYLCVKNCQRGFVDIDGKCVRKPKCKPNEDYDSDNNTCIQVRPEHSHKTNDLNGWSCNRGYILVDDNCETPKKCKNNEYLDSTSNNCEELYPFIPISPTQH